MNKKFFLSVFLLGVLTLSSGVLTSCIDNDEPEGITTLRGAKAELLRAKAALELAKAETEKQQALYVAAMAEHEKALAEVAKAEAEKVKAEAAVEAAKVAIVEAQAALANAQADAAKADAEKALAEAEKVKADAEVAKAQAEADIEEIKQNMELTRLKLEAQIAGAQQTLDQTLAEIEAAKAVLTDDQQTKLDDLKEAVETAWGALKNAQSEILTQMSNVFDETNDHADQLEAYQNNVINAKAKLIAVNAAYDELTELANSVSITAWEARRDSIKAYVGYTDGTHILKGAAEEEKAILALKKLEIEQSAEYKAKAAEDAAARDAYVFAQMEYNYLANGYEVDCFDACVDGQTEYDPDTETFGYFEYGTHPETSPRPSAKKYGFAGVTIPVTNQWILDKIVAPEAFVTVNGVKCIKIKGYNDWDADAPLYQKWNTLGKNDGFSTAFNTNYDNFAISTKITKWKKALKNVKFTDEDIAADSCKETYQKDIEDAQDAHDKAVAAWDKAHKVYSEGKVEKTVSTDAFKAAIKLYNDNIDALEAAVKTYNEAWDAAFVSQTDIILAALKDAYMFTDYKNYITGAAGTLDASICAEINTQSTKLTAAKTIKDLEVIVDFMASEIAALNVTDYNTAAKVKAAALKYAKKEYDYAEVEDGFKTTAETEALNGVIEGGSVTSGSTTATFATKVLSVNEVKAVKDALYAINSTDSGKEGLVWKLSTPAGYDATKKVYSGSVKTIDAAVENFKELAKENSEKLTSDALAASATTKTPEYTGVNTYKYIAGGTKSNPSTQKPSATEWTKPLCILDGDNYLPHAYKLQVVRTQVSDEAIAKMTAVEFWEDKAKENWQDASAAAFGTDNDNTRHTELTADMVKYDGTDYKDENGKVLPTYESSSTLYSLVAAKEALAKHEALVDGAEDLAAVLKAVETYEAAIKAKIAEYQESINEAYAAIAPAKKAHQVAHNAAAKLTEDINAQIQAVEDKKDELTKINTKLTAIITAYYSNIKFSYVNENGELVEKYASDVENLKDWIKDELKKYEKEDPSFVSIPDVYTETQGKIKDAEFKVSYAQKILDRYIADEDFDDVAQAQLALEQAQQDLAVAQQNYDFALAQLNAYVAALGQ